MEVYSELVHHHSFLRHGTNNTGHFSVKNSWYDNHGYLEKVPFHTKPGPIVEFLLYV